MIEINKIHQGDCIEVMKSMPDNSVDAIVTDPPYELGFMGKHWDNSGIAYNIIMWKECLRVLKSGGHLLSFGGSRTYHRMACAIEDAGFEVRDMIEWVYGSGFPKSLNIGKAVDKLQGNEREEFEHKYASRRVNNLNSNASHKYGFDTTKKTDTKGTSEWEGWGTALKPAHEPIVLARKPLSEKTVAENVLKFGTGGINIDGCRVEYVSKEDSSSSSSSAFKSFSKNVDARDNSLFKVGAEFERDISNKGRFPANLIHDGSDEVIAEFPDVEEENTDAIPNKQQTLLGGIIEKNIINSSRFFYCAKASKEERNYGCEGLDEKETHSALNTKNGKGVRLDGNESAKHRNNHPTVKPLSIMEYLIKLVTPKGGIVLDPFSGSGTTCVAAAKLGFKFIGIEKEAEYVKIANARIKPFMEQMRLQC